MVERQARLYGRQPRPVAADVGYASQANLHVTRALGMKDVANRKKRGITVAAMVKSEWVYKKLRSFWAGIEANICCLKRSYGLTRCPWKCMERFNAYVWSAVVAYNLAPFSRLSSGRSASPLPECSLYRYE